MKILIGAIKIQLRTFEKLLMRGKLIAKVGEVTVEFNYVIWEMEKNSNLPKILTKNGFSVFFKNIKRHCQVIGKI